LSDECGCNDCNCNDCAKGDCDPACECGCQDNPNDPINSDRIKYIENLQERNIITKNEAKELIVEELKKDPSFTDEKQDFVIDNEEVKEVSEIKTKRKYNKKTSE
jgi:hypothetical protein